MISDWDYLERARQGDENAWRVLFQRYHDSLVRMASLITGSLDAGKDVAQETFIRLIKSRIKHHRGNFKSYISTIAYRLSLKEKKRLQRNNSNVDVLEIADKTPLPLDTVISDERNQHIARVIISLPENHRHMLVLRFYCCLGYEEIARITKTPLGTVKSRIFYAVKTCQSKLPMKGVYK